MITRKAPILIAGLFTLAALVGMRSAARPPIIEYRVIDCPEFEGAFGRNSPGEQLQVWLNQHGKDGWHMPPLEAFEQNGKYRVQPVGATYEVFQIVAWRSRA